MVSDVLAMARPDNDYLQAQQGRSNLCNTLVELLDRL